MKPFIGETAEVLELELAPRRSRTGFDEFYLSEYPRLTALATALAGTAMAEDIAQEAMLAAYRRWREVRDLERPDLWVRRTCSNLAISQFRRRVVELRALNRMKNGRQSLELSESGQDFWAAISSLPQRQAQASALRFVYDMPVADIAETLGCSIGTVKQHLHRARPALMRALAATDGKGDAR